ncbi:MAG: aminotransferase class V-fold PLP-dependent enzyme [Gemmatimonadota bacterium]|nr:aminotransferase class V-fold PLP-dependent enzyme [Gemmatimonadota bacterium]
MNPLRAEPPSIELIREGRFFLPGPTEVHSSVLQAQSRPLISHRGEEMRNLWARLQSGVAAVLGTASPVWISTSSATSMMEAAVRSCGARRVVCLVAGAFSRRFVRIARASGIDVDLVEVPPDQPHRPEEVAARVASVDADLVTMVHCETSTGVLNPVAELAAAVHGVSDALVAVDSVSGAGGIPVRPDDWGVDFLLTGSQKAFAVPPGLAFAVSSDRFLQRARGNPRRGLYLDPIAHLEAQEERGGPMTTPAISCLFALDTQLGRMEAEGLEARFARHRDMQEDVETWLTDLQATGIDVGRFAPEGAASPTVSVVRLPAGLPSGSVLTAASAAGYTVAPGYGEWRDTQLRIGHMGDHTREGVARLLDVLGPIIRG